MRAAVIGRCHVGLDTPNDLRARDMGPFLRDYIVDAGAYASRASRSPGRARIASASP
jgi:hypothetical protein